MRSNLTYTLDKIAEIYDGPHATPKKLEEGNAIFLSISSIENGRLNLEKSSFISEDDFVKWTRRVTPQAGDVVFSYETKIGEASIIPEGLRCCLGRRMGLLRAKQDKVLPQYLLYAYLSPAFQDVIREKTIHGSTTDRISIKEMPSFEIQLPDIHTQRKVIQILSSIDNKLSKNAEINQTLEQIAQALFKSWFIDFEPVKAKIMTLEAGGSQEEATLAAMTAISGKNADSLIVFEREYPEKFAELRATAELFPSAMQDIESAKLPEGWNLVPLSNIASFASGKINVSELTKDTYISTENMLVNKVGVERATSLPSANTTPSFKIDHILISNIRPYFKKIWLARFSGGRSPDVLAFEQKKNITAEYLYNILYQDSFFDFMMQTSKGVKMPRGDKTAIMGWTCIEPDIRLVKIFSNKVKEFYSYIESHNRENTQLSQLRDTLLPKLLSGEIPLPETEEIAKEADYV
ncbi:restriction endonuclease subunit S [Klebsiella pneumoniae]|uniref:restriction endonuclease subunit S n=1 Tax=Klebsiella pneumoniae TaxID=573 RepID=UPI001E4D45D8|nr:restriction endonuclease subunit S [Klebsiella pneumoniae]MCC4954578.1 restriction endonuclease subunit S [Klebsiella pneumoniae]